MSIGIEVFNADGSLQFNDFEYSLGRAIFEFSFGTSNGSVSLPPGYSGTGVPMVKTATLGKAVPAISINNGIASWDFGSIPAQYRATGTVLAVMY